MLEAHVIDALDVSSIIENTGPVDDLGDDIAFHSKVAGVELL